MAKRDWFSMDPVEVWECLRCGEIKCFPNNFLDQEICKILVRELVLNELKLTREEILDVDQKLFMKYKLGGVRKFFKQKLYIMLQYCFPELEIHSWELKKNTPGLWQNIEVRNDFVRTIAQRENIDLTKKEDISRFSANMIRKYGGSKALKAAGGLFELISPVISPDIKEWEVFKVSKWDEEKAITAVKWLIEDVLQWSHDEVYENISTRIFYKNNLGGLLSKFCQNSTLVAVNLAYPREYPKLKNERPIQFIKS